MKIENLEGWQIVQGGGVDKSKHNTRSSIGKHWASSYEMGCMGIGEMASGRMMLVHMWNVQADLSSTADMISGMFMKDSNWNVYPLLTVGFVWCAIIDNASSSPNQLYCPMLSQLLC